MAYNFGDYQTLDIQARSRDEGALANRNNSGVHPFFGNIVTDNDGKMSGRQDALEYEYQDFVGRELGISKQIVKNNNVLQGLANPGGYLLRKNQDMKRISDLCSIEYRTVYVKFVNSGYSLEESRSNAMKAAESKKDSLMKQHEIDFPTDISKQVKDKLKNQVNVNNF